jgi:hypothetical protein
VGYHVFIERAQDASPQGVRKLAQAISRRYGIAADTIAQRLANGRFRVKADAELTTATRYAADLETLGAICTVVAAGAAVSTTRGALPVTRADPVDDEEAPPRYGTGLAASRRAIAFDEEDGAPHQVADDSRLAALAALEQAQPQLATLDGEADEPPPPMTTVAFDDYASNPGGDPFAPPTEGAEEEQLQLAADPREISLRTMQVPPIEELTAPAAPGPVEPAGPDTRPGGLAGAQAQLGRGVDAARRALRENARVRFAVGVLLALLLGFVPAHIYAVASEGSEYSALRKQVRDAYADARTTEDWQGLDQVRAGTLEVMASRRLHIAINASLVWAGVGALLAWVWFRKLPWPQPS